MVIRSLVLCLAPLLLVGAVDEAASLSAIRKFQQIADGGLAGGAPVEFSQDELNAFLKFHGSPVIPDGVQNPELALREGGAIFQAVIDLEKAGAAAENLPVLMRLLLRGTRTIAVDFDYAVRDGKASLKFVSMLVEDIEIPESVLTWFVEAYAPPELRPYLSGEGEQLHIGLSDVRIEPGRAVAITE